MGEALKLPIGELFDIEKGSLQSLKNSPGEYDFITAAEEWKTHNEFSHDQEALIFAAAASGSLGRTHYVNGKFITSDLCYILTPKNPDKYPIDLKFYHFVFNSLKEEIVQATKSGTSKEAINQKSFKSHKLPYFDIQKQHLWIQKLVNTKQYQQELFSELSVQKDLVSKFRQSILQETIEGKLTVQWREENPDVESASILLKNIKDIKSVLIRTKQLKKAQEIDTSITKRDIKIPSNWEWSKGDDLFFVTKLAGFEYTKYFKLVEDGEIPVIRAQNVRPLEINRKNLLYIDLETSLLLERSALTKPSLLVTFIGAGIGDVACFEESNRWHLAPNVAKMEPFEKCQNLINLKYLNYFLMSKKGQFELYKHIKATAQPSLSMGTIRDIDYIIPPIEEQSQIVQKVENLFKICDELEQQINDSKTNAEMLMQAVLKEAFEEKSEPQAPKTFQRSVLAAYLIDNSQDDPFFGHVKLQKMLFMCEAVNNLDFETDYKRHAMGPYDPKLIRSVDSQLKKAKWFEVKKLEGEISRYVYHPLEKVEEYKKYVGRYWDHQKIEHIFQLMKPMRTLQAEIVATLFSANTDLKKTNISISDAILINEARNNWHDNKKNIAVETWEKAIEWMKSKNLL
jgi:type I restriction enzyme, S subunit